jgi:hypothetical protein
MRLINNRVAPDNVNVLDYRIRAEERVDHKFHLAKGFNLSQPLAGGDFLMIALQHLHVSEKFSQAVSRLGSKLQVKLAPDSLLCPDLYLGSFWF